MIRDFIVSLGFRFGTCRCRNYSLSCWYIHQSSSSDFNSHSNWLECSSTLFRSVCLAWWTQFNWNSSSNLVWRPFRLFKTNEIEFSLSPRVALNLDSATLIDMKSLFLFFTFTLLGSNIFSNVPLTLLVLEQVPRTGDHLNLILYLAFITTIAGNLTLFGSVANLIVAQKALTTSIEHRFDFWTYFKFGFPTTIIFSLIGMFIIYGLLNVIHWIDSTSLVIEHHQFCFHCRLIETSATL